MVLMTWTVVQHGDDNNNVQVSKAVVLQKSIEFIQYLGSQKKKQEAQLSSLRKEVMIGKQTC